MLVPVRQAISDQTVHAYVKFYVVYGRKPYPDEVIAQTGASSSSQAEPPTDIPMEDAS
jgi:hypothetical protein